MKTKPTIVKLGGRDIPLTADRDYQDESSQVVRAANAANFLLENWDVLSALGHRITCKKLRDTFIEVVGGRIYNNRRKLLVNLPERGGNEERAGDDRSNGDSIGGHCMKLPMTTIARTGGKKDKVITLDAPTKLHLETFLINLKTQKLSLID